MNADLLFDQKIAILGEGVTSRAVEDSALRGLYSLVDLDAADLVVASPGIPVDQFPAVSVPIISEIELAYRLIQFYQHSVQLIGITGTNGKSTLTALVAHLLDCPAVGNIGRPLISYVATDVRCLVVELSSYQLETTVTFRPNQAIFLPITPDHLARHQTMEHYFFQKSKMVQTQIAEDDVFYFSHDLTVQSIVSNSIAQKHAVDLEDSLGFLHQLLGKHNQLLVAMAIRVGRFCGVSDDLLRARLRTFLPLPHRLESLGTVAGRYWINDSKSTNLASTMVAVESCDQVPFLVLCGDDKQLNLDHFVHWIPSRVKGVFVFGQLCHCFDQYRSFLDQDRWFFYRDMAEALHSIMEKTDVSDLILFSPSSSSFDQFDHFEARGDAFKRQVQALI